MYAYACVVKNT